MVSIRRNAFVDLEQVKPMIRKAHVYSCEQWTVPLLEDEIHAGIPAQAVKICIDAFSSLQRHAWKVQHRRDLVWGFHRHIQDHKQTSPAIGNGLS